MQELLSQEKSIYLQIKEMIENDIIRDILLEEERVPSTNELAKLYAINPATAAKGVNLLASGAKQVIVRKRKERFFDDYIRSLLTEAASLGITKEELIDMIAAGKGEDAK